eukprot:9492273-Pyramimonas_sp.AAC.1
MASYSRLQSASMHGGGSGPLLGVSPRPRGSLPQHCAVPGGGLLSWAVTGSAGTRGGAVVGGPAPSWSAVLPVAG